MTAKERLSKYLEYKDISQYEFQKRTNLSNGYLNSGNNITSANLDTITDIFGDLNLVWVVKGIGPMTISEVTKRLTYKTESDESSVNILNEDYMGLGAKAFNDYLLKMTPEQLIEMNKALKLAIQSKEQTIQAKDDVIAALEKLVLEKDSSNKLKDELILQLQQNKTKGSL